MRHLTMRLAVALNTALLLTLTAGCSVEHDEDGANDLGVNLGECDCTVKAVIWVNSAQGGRIDCQGDTWQYMQGARIYPICMDDSNAGFTVSLTATGETWAEAWVIEEAVDDQPAIFQWKWTGNGPPPPDWPATGLASEVYLPNGGTFNAVVPE